MHGNRFKPRHFIHCSCDSQLLLSFLLHHLLEYSPHFTVAEHSWTRSLAIMFTVAVFLQFSSIVSYKLVTFFARFVSEAFISLLIMKCLLLQFWEVTAIY